MCEYSVVASGPWLFDVCISPAVMTVAAAGWVSGELIISVCHLWRGWSCDTGSSHTASLFWCGHWRCMCMCVYTCLCEESTWSALHITEGARHTHTHTHKHTHKHRAWCSCHLCSAFGMLVYKFALCTPLPALCLSSMRKWHQTSVCCHCGNTAGVGHEHKRRRRGERESEEERDGQ